MEESNGFLLFRTEKITQKPPQKIFMKKFNSTLVRTAMSVLAVLSLCMAQAATPLGRGTDQEVKPLAAECSVSAVAAGKQMPKPMMKTQGRQTGSLAHRTAKTPVQTPRSVASLLDAPGFPKIYGCVLYANSWTSANSPVGIYSISGDGVELVSAGPNAQYGGTLVGDRYYCTNMREIMGSAYVRVSAYNTTTWEQVSINSGSVSNAAVDVAYDPVTKKTYGCFQKENGSGYMLGTIDYSTLVTTRICDTDDAWCAFAVDTDGTLYGIAKELSGTADNPVTVSSSLYKINKTNGAKQLIGVTGCLPYYISSACIDPKSGRMFWTVSPNDETGALYEVNKTTGAATLLKTFADGEEVTGLFILVPEAEDKAPAACSDIEADFPKGAFSGTVSFTAPSTLFDDTPASGRLAYKVVSSGETLATGETSYGARVSANVKVSAAGNYNFDVSVSNEAGDSPVRGISVFVGNGTPALTTVTATYADGKFNVQWTPVTESADGGYIDPEKVTYRLTRYPSRAVVASAMKETTFEDAVSEPDLLTAFYYTVEADCNGLQSGAATSNTVWLGSIHPPYEQHFNDESVLDNYTILNANGDERTWGFYQGEMRIYHNKNMAMDDWLITPAVRLEEGRAYELSIGVRAQSASWSERFEVKFGETPTAEAMTSVVIEPTLVNSTTLTVYNGYVVPPHSGKFYIGIHGCSDADTYYLYVDDLMIAAASSAAGPDQPTGLTVVPDPNGAYRATVSVNAPTADLGGNPLTAIDRLELLRDDMLIKTFYSPEPGARLTYGDEVGAEGEHTYTAVAYTTFGKGRATSVSAFIGVNPPAAPSGVSIEETENLGEVKISWDAVATDANGYPLNSDLVTYTIYQLQAETHVVLYDDIVGTSHTFRAIDADTQNFVHYYVSSQTRGGISAIVPTDLIPVGKPHSLPFVESFPNADTETIMAIGEEGTATWSLFKDENNLGIVSQDGNNGFVGSRSPEIGAFTSLYTGKILIDGNTPKPGVSLYTYSIVQEGIPDANEIEISVDDGTGFKPVKKVAISDLTTEPGWVMVSAPLDDYVGKVVLIDFKTTVRTYEYTLLDNIKVGSLIDNNLAVNSIVAPQEVKPNTPFVIDLEIENLGVLAASGYNVTLYRNRVQAGTVQGEMLAPGSRATISFTQEFNVLNEDAVEYYAVVEFAADEALQNNTSETLRVSPIVPVLPHVTSLSAKKREEGVLVSWTKPSTDGYIPAPETEDFEAYESFATSGVGDWLFRDGDQAPIGTISDLEIPGIAFGSKQSWWVMDADYEKFNRSFAAHSGSKYLAQMYATEGVNAVQCDDWIISPELLGVEQTVTFFARSYSGTYPEDLEFLYSMTGTEVGDFTSVATRQRLPQVWTQFSFKLPEGAKYFAIRCISNNKFMLFIDDISFISAVSAEVSVIGYNVWCDGVKINDRLIEDTRYMHAGAEDGDQRYVVTTVYDKGESKASPSVGITLSVEDEKADRARIFATEGTIVVTGAEDLPFAINMPDGRAVSAGVCTERTEVPVMSGVYMVKVGHRAVKVFVK